MTSGSGKLEQAAAYTDWVSQATQAHGETGLHVAVGGEFEAFGIVQREMLKHYGLAEDGYLVDVGCGSGRLAAPLQAFLKGRYLGIDIVAELVAHARSVTERANWRFEIAHSLTIPEATGSVDMVCFFSVLTHLLHEQSYIYLEEAKRVLKPGGRIVFSFLEFAMDFHWTVFEATVEDERSNGQHPLNVFFERAAIAAWAKRLDLSIVEIRDGSDAFVPLPHPPTLQDGRVMQAFGNLGQSICVLSR